MKRRSKTANVALAQAAGVVEPAGTCELIATLRFSFPHPVTDVQLKDAILRSAKTVEFGISGQVTVVSIEPPILVPIQISPEPRL